MAKFDDFDLDVVKVSRQQPETELAVTSKSLCTPGCKTGILQTCAIKSATCGCSIHIGGKK